MSHFTSVQGLFYPYSRNLKFCGLMKFFGNCWVRGAHAGLFSYRLDGVATKSPHRADLTEQSNKADLR